MRRGRLTRKWRPMGQRPITCLTNRLAFMSTPIDVIHLNQIGSIPSAQLGPPPHQRDNGLWPPLSPPPFPFLSVLPLFHGFIPRKNVKHLPVIFKILFWLGSDPVADALTGFLRDSNGEPWNYPILETRLMAEDWPLQLVQWTHSDELIHLEIKWKLNCHRYFVKSVKVSGNSI